MVGSIDVTGLDPLEAAPPQLVAYRPSADDVGHGRTLPLIGNARNYLFDVLPDPELLPAGSPRVRVYADRHRDVLSVLIPDYAGIAEALTRSEETGTPEEVTDAFTSAFDLRTLHAHSMRVVLQRRLNQAAQASGSWSRLTEEEAQQCSRAAEGQIPVGIPVVVGGIDADGNTVELDMAVWETDAVPLVVNRGDYGFYSESLVPEPVSELAHVGEDGDLYVYVTEAATNVIVLNPTDEDIYVESLASAGLLVLDEYLPEDTDPLFIQALLLGRAIADGVVTEGGPATYADIAPSLEAPTLDT